MDKMAQTKQHSYRKSDDAQIDVNKHGPVYCKILKKRREVSAKRRHEQF